MCVKKTVRGSRKSFTEGDTSRSGTKTRKMPFASDKLYNGYMRRNMPTFVKKLDAREIMYHLPCLTPHDRENIEAKRETRGNSDSVVALLDCLKRRENWPEQFIEALDACEQPTLAAEIRAEYDALRGVPKSASQVPDSSPSSPPTTVVRAHVHPAPSAGHVSVPASGASGPAAAAPPAGASAPSEPAAPASPPLETPVSPQDPQSSAARLPKATSPPEPVPEPPRPAQVEVTPPPSTPPPSPASTTPPPQREVNSHQEPEENSESDVQDVCGDDAVIPDQTSAANQVSIAPPPSCPAGPRETDAPSPDRPHTTTTSTEVRPPQSPSPAHINSDVTDGSSFLTLTPKRPPVQDTSPPVDVKPAAVLQPEETSEPPAAQVVGKSRRTQTKAPASPQPAAAAENDVSVSEDFSVYLSKPGRLVSMHPQNYSSPTIPAPNSPEQFYSGNSERLEMSDAAADDDTSAHLPACSAVTSTTVRTASALPCQEQGIAFNHNEPEENYYESPAQSLGMQTVQENSVHVSGERPSIMNLDGQIATPQVQIVTGEAAKQITSAPPLSNNAADCVVSVNAASSENHLPSEPAPAEPKDSQEKMASRTLPANTKYILMAAGVGACALLMAWRFRNKGI
ncbi:LOW QUALITY PROTEIN: mitochondrial antiviral-signaling protein-like [Plectropomus leopardus]|uniref:LOW QUALITY PROTEIN: mitochondrial antiviral-signaling protein-like n=1 Tax=Plectropomus leopardus TaxID=160734 RepID=UPI001C4D7B17|nr:LOW QUALITY PROTEIN: mitochondrial antiviral-signaling protein-like [Plectropomus leopardus]